jgi:hypothetical protein
MGGPLIWSLDGQDMRVKPMKIPRWRLRSAMLLIALIAVMLAVCASLRSRALTRQKSIEAVDRLRGTYGVRITGPDWYRRLLGRVGVGEKAFYDPTRVSLGPGNSGYDPGHPIRDADIEDLFDHLAGFSNLELLDLRECRLVTDRGIAKLPVLPRLRHIRLSGTSVTEEGVRELRRRYPGVKVSR